MTEQAQRDKLIGRIVAILYEAGAHDWNIQDKGVLMAAIKLQLQENVRDAQQRGGRDVRE